MLKRMERHYIKVYDWMIKDGLKGNELLVYAIIYNWCNGTGKPFDKPRIYLAEKVGISVVTAQACLAKLEKSKRLKKEKNGHKQCVYSLVK